MVTNEPSKQVTNLQNNKAGNDAEARKKIQALRSRLDAGEDFGSVATRFSEDPNSSSNGGDSGFVFESQLRTDYPDVFAAVSKLKAGQTTEILPVTQGAGPGRKTVGYAIYMLYQKAPAGQREMSDPRVQVQIHQTLHNIRAQVLREAYFEMLDSDAKIHNYLAEQIYKNGAN